MPTELEELVEFLHHGNTQIRQVATENLVPYSKTQPSIFKAAQLTPVKDLRLLVRDYPPIAQHALTILINISGDGEVLKALAEDEKFLESVLGRVMNPKEPNADSLSMLLANLSKSDSLTRLLGLKRAPIPIFSPSPFALDQLTHLFNRGANRGYNPKADYDYLAYIFADLAKFPPIASHLTSPSPNDPLSLPPITLLTPFTTHPSSTRRLGLSSLLHNLTLSLPASQILPLLSPPISILPHLLLPLCGPDPKFSETETDSLLPELQLLGNDHRREQDLHIIKTLLETIYVIAGKGGKEARTVLKDAGAYLVVRELHLDIEDEGVRAACERVVDLLMVDDDDDGGVVNGKTEKGEEVEGVTADTDKSAVTEELDPAVVSLKTSTTTNTTTKEPTKSENQPLTTTDTLTPTTTVPNLSRGSKLAEPIPNPAPDNNSPPPSPPTGAAAGDDDSDEDDNRIIEIF